MRFKIPTHFTKSINKYITISMDVSNSTKDSLQDITQGTIWKQILYLFFPILFGIFFQQLYNTVDAIIVGRFLGKESLAAVGGGTSTIINLLVGFFVGLSSGATVIVSQFYGAKNTRDVQYAVHTAFALAITGGVILMLVSLLAAPLALRLIGTPEVIFEKAIIYLRIYFAGILPLMLYNISSGILRAVGDTKRPLYFLIAGMITNIILDLVFIGLLGWGIQGAAFATVAAQSISMILTCRCLIVTTDSYKLHPKKIHFALPILKRILSIGFPAGIQAVMYSLSNIIIQANINALGTNTIAAWAAFGRVDSFYWMILNAFGLALTTFAGQNYGAKNYKRVLQGTKTCVIIALFVAVIVSTLMWIFAEEIFSLFITDKNVIHEGIFMIRFFAQFFVMFIPIELLSGTLRGAGKTLIPTLISAICICFFRIVWLATVVPYNQTIFTVMVCYPITWAMAASTISFYFLRKKWLPTI